MQNSREAFEKCIRKSLKGLHIARLSVDGEYTNRSMQGRWLIWQESRNHLIVEIPMMSAKNSKSENRIIENIIIFIEQQGIKVEIPSATPDDQHQHQPAHTEQDGCQWNPDEDYVYSTGCGNEWQFTEGGLKDNQIKFCPYCSGKIAAPKPESDL